jgi:hypothetical protein
MSLKKYKKIENKRGFFIDDVDSEVFEIDLKTSLYGNGLNDVIQFTLYDVNENLLPQQGFGNTRYIKSSEFEKYFKKEKSETGLDNQPRNYELFVDKIIEDAGYNNGLFKIEVLLVNDRVGGDGKPNRVWIHEISPSRTEIRVLPINIKNKPEQQIELNKRYNAFMKNELFLDDVREVLPLFLESIGINDIETLLIEDYGVSFTGEMASQYFSNTPKTVLFENILNDFRHSLTYLVNNRNFDVESDNFGNPLASPPPITLNIKPIALQILRNCIEKYIPSITKRKDIEKTYKTTQFEINKMNLV